MAMVDRDNIRGKLEQPGCVKATTDNNTKRLIHTRDFVWHPGYPSRVKITATVQSREDGNPGSHVTVSFQPRLPVDTPPTEEFDVRESPIEIASMVRNNAEGVCARELGGSRTYIATKGFHDVEDMKDVRSEPVCFTPTFYGGDVRVVYRNRFFHEVGERTVRVEESYPVLCEKLKEAGYELGNFYSENATATDLDNNRIVLYGEKRNGDIIRTTHVRPRKSGDGAEIYRVRFDENGHKLQAGYIYVKEDVERIKGTLKSVGESAQIMPPRRVLSQRMVNDLKIKPKTGPRLG